MAYYPERVRRRSLSPKCSGTAAEHNAAGVAASFECGSFVRVSLRIDQDSKTIADSGFNSNGCGFAVAAADVVVELLRGRNLRELDSFRDDVLIGAAAAELGPFPEGRSQCLILAIEAVRYALSDHRNRCLEEFRGEKPIACTCFGVTEEAVIAQIAIQRPASVDEIADLCRAGSGCGSCRMLLEELLEQAEPIHLHD